MESAIERLTNEIDNSNGSKSIIGKHLLEHLNTDEVAAQKYVDNNITLDRIMKYVNDEAKKKAVNGVACIEDIEVFGWAIHYVDEGRHEEKYDPSQAPKVKTKDIEIKKVIDKPKKVLEEDIRQPSLFDLLGE